MGDFVNTINVVGDDVLCGSIIDKSVTEFKDDKITLVGEYAFYYCENLKTLEIPNVVEIKTAAFYDCTSLGSVKLPSLVYTSNQIFRGCTSLKKAEFFVLNKLSDAEFSNCINLSALILRMQKLCPMGRTNILSGTAIANGTGYVYVPRALVDSYKTATNWSTLSDQFRALEDYTVDGTITGELDESKI